MELEDLTYQVRGAIFSVHNTIGAGLFESVYEAALIYELQNLNLKVQSQVAVPLIYKTVKLDVGFKLDIIVEDCIIIEIKSIEMLLPVHKKQLLTYLKLSKNKIGFLVNFNSNSLDKENLIRIVN